MTQLMSSKLKRIEMIENSLRENTQVVITEHGISPTLLLGSLPLSGPVENNGHELKKI